MSDFRLVSEFQVTNDQRDQAIRHP